MYPTRAVHAAWLHERQHGDVDAPIPYDQVVKAVQISAPSRRCTARAHPYRSPDAIGVRDIRHPRVRRPVEIRDGEVPVFGPAASLIHRHEQAPPFAITHAPGCMLITDTKNINLKE